MNVEFRPIEQAWQRQGRPRNEPGPELLDLLREAAGRPGQVAIIPAAGTTRYERIATRALITRGAELLGLTVHIRTSQNDVRFYVEGSR